MLKCTKQSSPKKKLGFFHLNFSEGGQIKEVITIDGKDDKEKMDNSEEGESDHKKD